MKRQLVADSPDKLRVTDITDHPTSTGKVCCAAVVDVFPAAWSGRRSPITSGQRSLSPRSIWRGGDVNPSLTRWCIWIADPIHLVGVRAPVPSSRAGRIDGPDRVERRQRPYGVVLVYYAT